MIDWPVVASSSPLVCWLAYRCWHVWWWFYGIIYDEETTTQGALAAKGISTMAEGPPPATRSGPSSSPTGELCLVGEGPHDVGVKPQAVHDTFHNQEP